MQSIMSLIYSWLSRTNKLLLNSILDKAKKCLGLDNYLVKWFENTIFSSGNDSEQVAIAKKQVT